MVDFIIGVVIFVVVLYLIACVLAGVKSGGTSVNWPEGWGKTHEFVNDKHCPTCSITDFESRYSQ